MAIFNDRIRELRQKKNLTLKEAALKIGTTEATMQRYESGKGIKSIPYNTIVKLAELFECSPAYIMGWERYSSMPNAYCLYDEEFSNNSPYSPTVMSMAEIQDTMAFFHDNPAYIDLLKSVMKISPDDIELVKEMLNRFYK